MNGHWEEDPPDQQVATSCVLPMVMIWRNWHQGRDSPTSIRTLQTICKTSPCSMCCFMELVLTNGGHDPSSLALGEWLWLIISNFANDLLDLKMFYVLVYQAGSDQWPLSGVIGTWGERFCHIIRHFVNCLLGLTMFYMPEHDSHASEGKSNWPNKVA
jgi:hypothetical protein